MRLDQILVKLGKAKSRTHAKELIVQGLVSLSPMEANSSVGGIVPLTKASQVIPEEQWDLISVENDKFSRFVSRAGLKLAGAIEKLNLNVVDLECLDVGISTGGFTDCLLQNGAKKIVGVDVGHGQLALKLQEDPRVLHFEGINARNLADLAEIRAICPVNGFDLIVVDVSFISLTYIIPNLKSLLSQDGKALLLVKPQFELSAELLDKNGIVKDKKMYDAVRNKIIDCCQKRGLNIVDYFDSELIGRDGNREFFIYVMPNPV